MKYKLIAALLLFTTYNFANPINTGHADVSLVKYTSNNSQADELFIGIKMDMQKNWHTYWKNPGDSGGPIKVSWNLPDGVAVSDIYWPTPKLIPYSPLMTYGYKDFVIFPFKVTYESFNELKNIKADIDFLICDDICVPEKAQIDTSFEKIPYSQELKKWINKVPNVTFPILANQNENNLQLRFSFNDDIENIYFFIDQQDIVLHSKVQNLSKEKDNWLLSISTENNPKHNEKLKGVIVINDESYLIDSDLSIDSYSKEAITIIKALIFAFIGGLILNLMPCVFPIISLKVLSFISLGGDSTFKIRAHSIMFSFGVLASFLFIATLLIMLKSSGSSVGWGFQLQSPLIVGLLSLIMFLIGLILLMDINLGSSFTRLGSIGSNSTNYSSSFATGVLAVVVASPCTAPFMGAAIGYALIQPSSVTLPIFLSLGLGFAFPYLLISFRPSLISSLPQPGKWMETLKEFFAFPMFATALWLLWVFSLQTSADALINLLISILLISFVIWFYTKVSQNYLKILLPITLLLILIFQINQFLSISTIDVNDNEPNLTWNIDTENELISSNQAYLINFTAAWCITCQANDKVALSRKSVKEYLKNNNIEYIIADWTNRDENILKVLNKYGRSGVPLYVFWKPGMQDPIVLPSILTESLVLDTLNNY
jgi:thiol:disulfide interchange protein DsbD